MGNTDQEMVPLIEINGNDQKNDLAIDIREYPADSEPAPECCIYKIPERFREAMTNAYTPQLISIGPLHHGKGSLAKMEWQKLSYGKKFCERISDETIGEFQSYIEKNLARIVGCYDELVFLTKFTASKFKWMILYDAVFIIELFLRHFEKEASDFLLKREWFRLDLRRDFILLENQLPFFVFEDLYNIAFVSPHKPSFLQIACSYLDINEDLSDQKGIKHFTDLARCALVKTRPPNSGEKINKVYSATMLHEGAGVRFKADVKNPLLNVQFEKGNLRMPTLYLGFRIEAVIRNVMILEQCHYPKEACFRSYIQFLDSLIDTDKDVDLLVKNGIIDNGMGSSAAVADKIKTMMVGIPRAQLPTCYAQIGNSLNKYYGNFWNRLRHAYFKTLCRGSGTVAAFVVLLLTVAQTVLAILDRVMPTK